MVRTNLSEIVDEIEANKDRAADVADAIEHIDGVVRADQVAGKLHVAIESHVDVKDFAAGLESNWGVEFDAHYPTGSRPRLDGPRLSNDELVFTV